MATGFKSDDGKCQGVGCRASSGIIYNVKAKKKLCHKCATKTGSISKVRKNQSELICDRHDKSMRLYCKTHSIALCQLCAFKKHQKPCLTEDIDLVLREKRKKLSDSKQNAIAKMLLWKDHGNGECRQELKRHFEALTNEVHSVFNDGINMIKENEEKSAKIINYKADEEIQMITQEINVKRESRLKKCHEGAERERQQLENRRNELLDEVTAILPTKVQGKLDGLHTEARDVIQATENAPQKIETFLEDVEDLLNGAQQLITSLTDTLKKTVEKGVVEDITHTVNSVRFIRGVGKEKYNGRIGHHGKWELSGSVGKPHEVLTPRIVGCINEDDIIVSDRDMSKYHTHVINLSKGTTTRVVTSDGNSIIVSCALLDENTIVCGKYREGCSGDSLRGCISLYDRQWKLIRDITIPRNTSRDCTWVYTAVDQDGMIIAVELIQPNIYIINPADGSIINNITCKGSIKLHVCGVLSSGDIVALPYPFTNKVLIIDRQGTQREIMCKNKIFNCSIDPLTDDLYTLSWDEKQKIAVVHQMSSNGQQEGEQVLTYQVDRSLMSHGWNEEVFLADNQLIMTKSGKVIISNGRKFLLYKKI